jgi:3'-5' exoribonuclease
MKNIFIKDLKTNNSISDETFAIKSVHKRLTKDGKPYLDVTLSDKTGSVKGKIWSDRMGECDEPKEGNVVKVYAKIESFKDQPQLNISALTVTTDYDLADLTAVSSHDIKEMSAEIDGYIQGIKNKHLKKLLENIFTPEFKKVYFESPAAYTIHHAYKGGMLEHVLDIIKMGEAIIERYPKMNKDLFITGAILHDLGKLEEYTQTTTINLTDRGRLLGHVYMGAEYVQKNAPKDMPEDLLDEVIHMILSHQEQREFGSPVVPKTTEAIALATIDDVSFKVNTVYHTIHDGNTEAGFTDFQRHLQTDLYRSKYIEDLPEDDIPF